MTEALRKLDRAKEHLKLLKFAIERWEKLPGYSIHQELQDDQLTYVVWANRRRPLPDLAPLIGDCAHNIRSTLDHLVWQLGERHSGIPLPDDIAWWSEFPVAERESQFTAWRAKKIRGVSPGAQAVIEELQPYKCPDGHTFSPLWRVHELDRIDKHRTLHVTALAIGSLVIPPQKDITITNVSMGGFGVVLEDEALVAMTYEGQKRQSGPAMKMNFKVTVDVVLDSPGPLDRLVVVDVLTDAIQWIEETLIPPLSYFLPIH